ncbi:MAG: phage Gp37/Gp68 family protein [Ruminococcus flavefaciens]|nr:phage Gp37/Gp68 family protein [Ruminococcus flavefaciens]
MKKTKIDWCDSTINCVYGCPNNCEYCYGNVMNNRFHYCKDWKIPEWEPKHLKDFYSKKPKSVFIDSMSDIGTWQQDWFNQVIKAIRDNPQHRYIALTKRLNRLGDLIDRCDQGIVNNLWIGISITTQAQADSMSEIPDFYSIEPILEPINLIPHYMPKTLIIGAETGNRKGKVIPQKQWIDSLVRQADELGRIVFMKGSLRELMGDDFRQDKLPWQVK